ncbi:MAG: putative cell division protein FtsQ [Actinomycetota bacterium]
MSRDETPIDPSVDETAVTEVPADVLGELSSLLGVDQVASESSDSGETKSLKESPSVTNETVHRSSAESGSSAGESVVIIDDSVTVTAHHGGSLVDSSIVVIDDERHGSTVLVDADQVDRIIIVDDDQPDPRFEERREKIRRREQRRQVRWVYAAGVAIGAFVLVVVVLASPLFSVRNITIDGRVYVDSDIVKKATDALNGVSVFSADIDRVEGILREDPWVEDVRVETHFPSSAIIEIDERTPVVWFAGSDNKARVIDADGVVITVLDGWPTGYLQIVGTGPNVEPGVKADQVYRAVAQLVTALPAEIKPKVRDVGITGTGEITLTLKSGTLIRFGQPTDLQDKLVAVVVLLRRQDPANLAAIDVSTGDVTVQTR